ncbi:methyltransferase domain-containing protein [Streptomyces sp. NPDC050738]|uniref:methyltransferase domain-containing protein n=1 Tax=Streptomyces sp. NPDC050738 TaxID=3154744 RepID=UPI00341D57FD
MDKETQQTTDSLIAVLDAAERMPGAAGLRERIAELLGVSPGQRVVDVGCGTGRAVAELAELRGVRTVGVDPDERMIAVARERLPAGDFRAAGAYALPLGEGSVHGYRAEKVFHELADPIRALTEARRVLVPGGRAVLAGQDWETLVVDADDPALTRRIVQARADLVTSPRVARQYRNLLLAAGFRDVAVEVHTAVFIDGRALPLLTGLARAARAAGAVTAESAGGWIAEQSERARTGRLFLAVPFFVAAGVAGGEDRGLDTP